jgi:hypothetical protein
MDRQTAWCSSACTRPSIRSPQKTQCYRRSIAEQRARWDLRRSMLRVDVPQKTQCCCSSVCTQRMCYSTYDRSLNCFPQYGQVVTPAGRLTYTYFLLLLARYAGRTIVSADSSTFHSDRKCYLSPSGSGNFEVQITHNHCRPIGVRN